MTTTQGTKERILDTAEALFARHGFASTSVRTVTRQAEVNLASVSYHFGSKDALIRAVLARRIEPLNRERITRLDRVERDGVSLERVLSAFVAPALELSQDASRGGERFRELLGRSMAEPSDTLRDFIHSLYADVLGRYKAALAAVLPELPEIELDWRLHFLIGVLAYTLAGTDVMRLLADRRACDPRDPRAALDRMIPFLAAGFRAPLSPEVRALYGGAGGVD